MEGTRLQLVPRGMEHEPSSDLQVMRAWLETARRRSRNIGMRKGEERREGEEGGEKGRRRGYK